MMLWSLFSEVNLPFEKEVRLHKTETFGPIVDTINRMKAVLNEDEKDGLECKKMLAQIREEKTKRLESDINADRIKNISTPSMDIGV